MTSTQIESLLQHLAVPDPTQRLSCIETHISWVLLADHFAYKIKKPVAFSFLDFSSLERRKYYCEREIVLNNRLTEGVYLEILPVCAASDRVWIGAGAPDQVIDYAVKMKRLDNQRQMNQLLARQVVSLEQIAQLATQLAAFHAQATVIKTPFELDELKEKFSDLLKIKDFVAQHWGQMAAVRLERTVERAAQFLQQYAPRLRARSTAGYVVDGHGDLHAGNIFLLEKPVIFDCIEFNDQFRYVDMLDEIAFLCLDFDFYNCPTLEAHFLKTYLALMPCLENDADQSIFHFYKLYRANVRLKVTALRTLQETDEAHLAEAFQYFELLQRYADAL